MCLLCRFQQAKRPVLAATDGTCRSFCQLSTRESTVMWLTPLWSLRCLHCGTLVVLSHTYVVYAAASHNTLLHAVCVCVCVVALPKCSILCSKCGMSLCAVLCIQLFARPAELFRSNKLRFLADQISWVDEWLSDWVRDCSPQLAQQWRSWQKLNLAHG